MRKVKKTDVWKSELERLEKQEKHFLEKRYVKKETQLNQVLSQKVPEKLQHTLDQAFAKAFTLVFEKGNGVIEKTYNRDLMEKNHKIDCYAAEVKKSRKQAQVFSKKATNYSVANTALSAVSGIGMGAFGVGLPDIPVFTAMLFRAIYEIALSYGFEYESEKERYFILSLIQGAMSHEKELVEWNDKIDAFIEAEELPEGYSQEEMIQKTAACLSQELLYMKFLQSIPIAGVIGGAYDVVYMKCISEYAKIKYGKRFVKKKQLNLLESKTE